MKYTKTALALVLLFGQVTENPAPISNFIEDDTDFGIVNEVLGRYSFGFNSANACDELTTGGGCQFDDPVITIYGSRIDRDAERWRETARLFNALNLSDALNRPANAEFGDSDGGGGQGNSTGEYSKETDCTDPIDLITRDHFEVETDFVGHGELPLKLVRTYHSNSTSTGEFGPKWSSNLRPHFNFDTATPTEITFYLFDGTALVLTNDSYVNGVYVGKWRNAAGKVFDLTKESDGAWTLVSGNHTENYYLSGLIHTVKIPNGEQLSYHWVDTTDKFSLLTSISHNSGESLQFTWTNGLISKMTDPAGNDYHYGYPLAGVKHLSSVEYPSVSGVSKKTYVGSDGLMTSLIDENGDDYAQWSYDTDGGAMESRNGSGANAGQNIYKVNKPVDVDANTKTVTTVNPFNKRTTYTFSKFGNEWKKTGVDAEQLGSCAGTTSTITYDTNGFKDIVTDNNGNITDFDSNEEGKLIKMVEAKGTPEERTTLFEYEPTFNFIHKMTTELAETTYTYYPNGLLNTHTIKNFSANGVLNETRTVSYSYTFHSNGLMKTKTVDGPRTDVADITTTHYDTKGYVTKVTNALGHSTLFSGHNVFGNPILITLPDGTVNRNTYNKRGWLTKTETDIYNDIRITSYTLDKVGQITKITKPDASVLDFEYDNAHRLVKIVRNNNQDEYKELTYDLASNVIKEDINNVTITWVSCGSRFEPDFCPVTTVTTQKSDETVYDVLSRVQSVIRGGDMIAQYTYDLNNNREYALDGKTQISRNFYDPLNRIYRSYDRNTQSTYTYYNEHDQVVRVLDPKGGNTYYKYDGFNQLLEVNSPDTGITTFSYDKAGNLLSQTDAKGIVSTFTYDTLNRVKTENFPGITRSYYYDQHGNCSHIGYLCQLNDEAGTHTYAFNKHGELTSRTDTVSGLALTMGWSYNKLGQIKTITHPNGMVVTYTYDALSQINEIKSGSNILFRNAQYLPFGPISSFYYGTVAKRDYFRDDRYRLTKIKSPNIVDINYVYDENSNITSAYNTYVAGTNKSRLYSYDSNDRLLVANDYGSNTNYTYDVNGNRTSKDGTVNTISSTSNRLTSDGVYNFEYDDNGNITRKWNATNHVYTYNDANRMTGCTDGITNASYTYNGGGQRVLKTVNGVKTWFVFDVDGKLLYEKNGSTHKSYIYFDSELIGFTKNNVVYYVQGDHLGRPEVVTTTSNSKVWQAKNTAFGRTVTLDSIGGFNVGFPGQYWDEEKGSFYNMFRDYDPSIGRYLQSDPIGLLAGSNTYAYVNGNPINLSDPNGLCPWCAVGAVLGGGLNAYSQFQANGGFSNFNWGSFLASAATGALGGGLGTAASRLTWRAAGSTWQLSATGQIAVNSVGSAAIGAGVTTAQNKLTGSCNSVSGAAINGLLAGGLGAGFGSGLSNAFKAVNRAHVNSLPLNIRLLFGSNALHGVNQPVLIPGGATLGNAFGNTIANLPVYQGGTN